MYALHFGEEPPAQRSVDRLRGIDGARVRRTCPLLARPFSVKWAGATMTQLRLNHPKLAKLTPAHIEARRKALREAPTRSGPRRGERRADSTPNRDMTCIHAALNLALTDGLITSGFAWRAKPRPIKNADRRSEIYLDRAPWQRYASATSIGVWKYSRSGTTKQAVNAGPRYPRSRQRSSPQPRRTSFRRRP